MKSILEKISTTNQMSFDLYKKGYEAWKNSSETDKNDFYHARIEHVLTFGGVFYGDGTLVQTSGSSTGLIRKYLWGPNFSDAFHFHDFLCFGDIQPSLFFEIFLLFDGLYATIDEKDIVKSNRLGSKYECYAVICSPHQHNFDVIDKFTRQKTHQKHRVLIKFIPSQLHISLLLNKKFFEYFDPQKYVFQVTGEVCSDEVKSYFKKHGLELRDSMKVWNGGAAFYTCKYGNLHWDDFSCYYHEDLANPKKLICTDLFNLSQLFYNVPTGDSLEIKTFDLCDCGLRIQKNTWHEKFSYVVLNNTVYNWMTLRNDFVYTLSLVSESMSYWWENLLGLSIGINKNSVNVFYEVKTPLSEQILNKVQKLLQTKWNTYVVLERGLKINRFKTKRVFIMDDEVKFS